MAPTAHALPSTANDRLKGEFQTLLALSLLAATLTHLLVFELWPTMTTPPMARPGSAIEVITPLEPIELPPAPERLARPATPVASVDVDPGITVPPTTWERHEALPPPDRKSVV